jgi:hypothetical protein
LIGIRLRVGLAVNDSKAVRTLHIWLSRAEQGQDSLDAFLDKRILHELIHGEYAGRAHELVLQTRLCMYESWSTPEGKAWLSGLRHFHLALPWPPACIECARDLPRISTLDWHVAHEHTDIVCARCSALMDSPHHLKAHQEATHAMAATWTGGEGGAPFHCILCRETSQTWAEQCAHTCSPGELIHCSRCKLQIRADKFFAHDCQGPTCSLCGASAANEEMLERHRAEKHKTWICETCGKQCSGLGELRVHNTAAHQPQTCSLCEQKFETIAAREVHEGRCLLRRDLVPLVCGHCPYTTASQTELNAHVSTLHPFAAARPPRYPCPVEGCGYMAYYPGGVYQHMGLVHKTIPPVAPLPSPPRATDSLLDEDTQRAIELSYADLRDCRPNPIPRPATALFQLWQVRPPPSLAMLS